MGNIIFCIMIFCMGTVFGSFFTLAVYRIPLGLDITHERSFCPNCNHKLSFKDLIPIFSYIFLGGKCRYCKTKIRIRYLLLEVLSGLVFLTAYLSFNISFPNIELEKLIAFIAFVSFYVTTVLIMGIEKEHKYIEKHVLIFGILTSFMYMLYLYISKSEVMGLYRYGMYLLIMLVLFIIDTITLKNSAKSIYIIQILMFIDYIMMIVGFKAIFIILILTLLYIVLYKGYKIVKFNLKDKPDILEEQVNKHIQIGFCLGIVSIVFIIVNNYGGYIYVL